jgi:hypothetical protein
VTQKREDNGGPSVGSNGNTSGDRGLADRVGNTGNTGNSSDTGNASAGSGTGVSNANSSSVSRGLQSRDSNGLKVKPSVKPGETPIGFEIDKARDSFIGRSSKGIDGSKDSAGPGVEPLDDGSGGPGHDDHDDDHHDGYKDDHHDDHHYDDDDIDINFYFSSSYCPNGWWYLHGDYNGDGYRDYVCTNGSYSVYWYGWSGSYWGCSPWYGWYYGSYSWWNLYPYTDRYRGVVYGEYDNLTDDPSYAYSDQPQEIYEEPMPLSAVEVARLEMSIGNPENAVDAFRAHLNEYPSDWIAVRELGIAKLQVGDRGDGIALISYAYMMEPSLSSYAVPVELFGNSDDYLRDILIDTVGWGHRNPSASAWLSVAVLMQAEGRDQPALRMIERAAEYGLDSSVESEMRAVLVRR